MLEVHPIRHELVHVHMIALLNELELVRPFSLLDDEALANGADLVGRVILNNSGFADPLDCCL